jgi:hypothetical protein
MEDCELQAARVASGRVREIQVIFEDAVCIYLYVNEDDLRLKNCESLFILCKVYR